MHSEARNIWMHDRKCVLMYQEYLRKLMLLRSYTIKKKDDEPVHPV